jgi:hypothetical protein
MRVRVEREREGERERERERDYKVNRGFDVLDKRGATLVLTGLVAMVPPNVLRLHGAESAISNPIVIPIHLDQFTKISNQTKANTALASLTLKTPSQKIDSFGRKKELRSPADEGLRQELLRERYIYIYIKV